MNPSGRIPDTHAEAWSLLPFLINGRIAPDDREWVEHHVESCDECRRELDEQRPLANEMRDARLPGGFSEQRSFTKLWTRIEASEGAAPEEDSPSDRRSSVASRKTVRWLAAAVFVQAIGLALLGITALNHTESVSSDFRTVTNRESIASQPAVRLVFTSDTSVASVAEILAKYDLQLIAGPGSAGVFTAAVNEPSAERSAESIAAALRNDSHIQFAEPIEP